MDPLTAMMLLQGVQAGVQAIPTSYDRYSNKRLKELQEREEAGQLGLSDEERALQQRELLDPIKQMQTEQSLRQQAAMSASGDRTAGQIQNQIQMEQQNINQSAEMAGMAVMEADLQRKKEEEAEIQDRLMEKGQRQQDRRKALTGQAVQGAQVYGKYQGSELPYTTQPAMDVSQDFADFEALLNSPEFSEWLMSEEGQAFLIQSAGGA